MTDQPTPDALRELYAAAIRPNMLMGLQDAELDGPGGTQRINEWADWIAKELAEVRDLEMEQLRAELDRVQQAACRTAENLRHALGRLAELDATIERVKAIHRPADYRHTRICVACSGYYGGSCDNGMHEWPCATAEALDRAQQPEGAEVAPNP